MIKIIEDKNIVFAKIIRAGHEQSDSEFYTDIEDEIQVGVVSYPKSHKTGAHYHNQRTQKKNQTDEIIIVKQGSARIDFYNNEGSYIKSCEIFKDDLAILYKGAHNITFYEDTKLFTIKPGGYKSDSETTRIVGANNLELIIEN